MIGCFLTTCYFIYRLLIGWNSEVKNDNFNLARTILETFVKDFADIYGKKISMKRLKVWAVDSFSGFCFENFYQMLRKQIRRQYIFYTSPSHQMQTQGHVKKELILIECSDTKNLNSKEQLSNAKEWGNISNNKKSNHIRSFTWEIILNQGQFFKDPIHSSQ